MQRNASVSNQKERTFCVGRKEIPTKRELTIRKKGRKAGLFNNSKGGKKGRLGREMIEEPKWIPGFLPFRSLGQKLVLPRIGDFPN